MIEPGCYARRPPDFEEIIARTEEHFWNPEDPDYVDFAAPFPTDQDTIVPTWFVLESNTAVWDRLDEGQRIKLTNQSARWSLSNILHGEQGALSLSASLCDIFLDPGAQEYAANQAREEARHVHAFTKYMAARFGGAVFPVGDTVGRLLGELVATPVVYKKIVGMQMLAEGGHRCAPPLPHAAREQRVPHAHQDAAQGRHNHGAHARRVRRVGRPRRARGGRRPDGRGRGGGGGDQVPEGDQRREAEGGAAARGDGHDAGLNTNRTPASPRSRTAAVPSTSQVLLYEPAVRSGTRRRHATNRSPVGAQEIEHDDDGIVGVAEDMDLVALIPAKRGARHAPIGGAQVSKHGVQRMACSSSVAVTRRRRTGPRENATSVG